MSSCPTVPLPKRGSWFTLKWKQLSTWMFHPNLQMVSWLLFLSTPSKVGVFCVMSLLVRWQSVPSLATRSKMMMLQLDSVFPSYLLSFGFVSNYWFRVNSPRNCLLALCVRSFVSNLLSWWFSYYLYLNFFWACLAFFLLHLVPSKCQPFSWYCAVYKPFLCPLCVIPNNE